LSCGARHQQFDMKTGDLAAEMLNFFDRVMDRDHDLRRKGGRPRGTDRCDSAVQSRWKIVREIEDVIVWESRRQSLSHNLDPRLPRMGHELVYIFGC
jgi:hypothetical protein